MRSRVLLAVLGVAALVALALGSGPSRGPALPPAGRLAGAPLPPAPETSVSAVDPARIRDVFHFADERAPAAVPASGPSTPAAKGAPTPASNGPRLVGLVWRSGRLMAALAAADGEVELAGPGEMAAGVTVLSVGEDRVRVRRPGGAEETLVLP